MDIVVTDEAERLHAEAIVIDGCSFFFEGFNAQLAESGVTAINFTVPMPMDDFPQALIRIKEYYQIVRADPKSRLVYSADNIRQCKEDGRFGAIIGCQNSKIIGTDLGLLEVFHRLGLRVLQLTYNERNHVADGSLEPVDAGLSHFGRRVVSEANHLGLVVDLSHASRKTCFETIELSRKPCIVSHAGIGAFVESPRTISDDVMRALADAGGVLGVTTHPNMNWRGGSERPTFDDFLQALEHAIQVMGEDHVAIGTDFVSKPKGYPQWMKDYLRNTYNPYRENSEVRAGLQSVMGNIDPREEQLVGFSGMQHLPRITQALLDLGYQPQSIKKILGGNFLRVFSQVWLT